VQKERFQGLQDAWHLWALFRLAWGRINQLDRLIVGRQKISVLAKTDLPGKQRSVNFSTDGLDCQLSSDQKTLAGAYRIDGGNFLN
jgi:hypothetical protein